MPPVTALNPFTRNRGFHARFLQAITSNWGGSAFFASALLWMFWATWKVKLPGGGNGVAFQNLYDMSWRYSYWGFAGYPLHRDPVQSVHTFSYHP